MRFILFVAFATLSLWITATFRFVLAQESTPSASLTPSASVPVVSASPSIQPTSSPILSTPFPSLTPFPLPSISPPTPPPVVISIPEVEIIPLSTPNPSVTPHPTLPIYFQVQSAPTPSPSPEVDFFNTAQEGLSNSAYRSIVVPALSLMTQTNADEFYKDDVLPKRTADLLYAIALLLIGFGVYLSFENHIRSTIKKLREKELVQYIHN